MDAFKFPPASNYALQVSKWTQHVRSWLGHKQTRCITTIANFYKIGK